MLRRGVTFAPPRVPPPEFWEDHAFGMDTLEDGEMVFTGVAAADGNLRDGRPIRARRAGWSAMSANVAGELRFAFFGVYPDRCPTAHRAEVWAIIMILRRAVFPP